MASAPGELRAGAAILTCVLAWGCDRGDGPDPDARAGGLRADTGRALQLADPQLSAACDTLERWVDSVTARGVSRVNGRFTGTTHGLTRYGCRITAADTLQPETAERPLEVVWRGLVARGWALDNAYVADSPDGSMLGLRTGSLLCVLQHFWQASSDDERVPRPDMPFRYDVAVECFREAARITDSITAPDSMPTPPAR